jgi:hypothetical protein
LLSYKKEWRGAVFHARRHRELSEELTTIDPKNHVYAFKLASAFRALAAAHAALDEKRDSLVMYREYTRRIAPLALERPRDEMLLSAAGRTFEALADLALELDEQGVAMEACGVLLHLGEELGRLYPERDTPVRLQAIAHRMSAKLHAQSPEEARAHARNACELYGKLCASPDALRADLIAYAEIFSRFDFVVSDPVQAIQVLELAEAQAGPTEAILKAQMRAFRSNPDEVAPVEGSRVLKGEDR